MADNATNAAIRAQHDSLVEELKQGKLEGRVKVILILGYAGAGKSNLLKLITGVPVQVGHGIESGTLDALCVLTTLGDEEYIFIDTPGFGATGYSQSRVKRTIQGTLGFATRCFGGIHGILYVHNIMTEREYEGMTQSLEFLRSLKGKERLPSLTFVTTNWDLVPQVLRQKYEDKISDLRDKSWKDFTDYGYIQFGFSYDHYPAELRGARRDEVVTQLVGRYARSGVVPVKMPFWEWTWGEIGSVIAHGAALVVFAPVWIPIEIISKAEYSGGNLNIGITSTGRVYVEHERYRSNGVNGW